jgi:hypothetical protein
LRLDLRLANGEHAELVPVLRSLIARHKWRVAVAAPDHRFVPLGQADRRPGRVRTAA